MKKEFPNWDLILRCPQEEKKLIGFEAFPICDFFINMEVLQLYGEKSKEYIHAIYLGGRLIGVIYLGNLYSEKDLNYFKQKYIPPTWEDIKQYQINNAGIWYLPLEQKNYAWIYRRILKEVKK